MTFLSRITLLFVTAALLGSCAKQEPVKTYDIQGKVERLNPVDKTATINAGEIKGWMEAMTMEYPVKDPKAFAKLHVNDTMSGKLTVQGDKYWISDVSESGPTK